MAKSHCIRTPKLTDRQIFDLVFAFKDRIGLQHASLRFVGDVQIDITSVDLEDEKIASLYSDRQSILEMDMRTLQRVQVMFLRGITSDVEKPRGPRQSSVHFDELYLSLVGPSDDLESVTSIVECIETLETHLPKVFPVSEPGKDHTILDVVQAEISALGGEYRKLTRAYSRERLAHLEEMKERRSKFEEECAAVAARNEVDFSRERQRLEDQQTELATEYQEKQHNLQEREKAFDDRHHMHARRDLRKKISEDFRNKFGNPVVSKPTRRIREVVFVLTLLAGLSIGAVGLYEIAHIAMLEASSSPDWSSIVRVARASIFLFLSVGFIAYAINWLRVCYLDDVRTERHFERYGHDIDRASFVIETIMEVGDKDGATVPDAWVEGVCRNLFSEAETDRYGKVPSGAMAMLLDVVSGAKFGPDGAEVSMNRRGARRASKALRDGS